MKDDGTLYHTADPEGAPSEDVERARKHFDAARAEVEAGLAVHRAANAESELRIKEALLADARKAFERG